MKRLCLVTWIFCFAAAAQAQPEPVQEAMDYAIAARRLHEEGDLNGALLGYSKAITLAQKTPDYYFERSRIKLQLGYPRRAVVDLEIALTFDKGYGDAWLQLGKAHYSLMNDDQALDAFTQAVLYLGDHAAAWAWRGRCYRRQGKDDAAVRALRRALELDPDVPGARLELGRALAANADLQDAVLEFSAFIRQAPENPAGYVARAQVCLQQALDAPADAGFFAQAAADLKRADKLEAASPAVMRLRLALARLQDDAAALAAAAADLDQLQPVDQPAVRVFANSLLPAPKTLEPPAAQPRKPESPAVRRRWAALEKGELPATFQNSEERAALHYYLGVHAVRNDKTAAARQAWQKAGKRPYLLEGICANYFLKTRQYPTD